MSVPFDLMRLEIRCAQEIAEQVWLLTDPIFAAHAHVTMHGGFSHRETTDSRQSPEFAVTTQKSPGRCRVEARARGVQRGAWRVLLEAVRGELLLKKLAEQAGVECYLETASGNGLHTQEVASLPYPSSPAEMPFQLTWTQDGPPFRALVRIFLVDVPAPDAVEEIKQVLANWLLLIRAYRPAQAPLLSYGGALATEPQWVQPYAVEVGLDMFLADEAVFHPVVNLAYWLHRYAAAVEELEID
jgi:hypothetical protein